MDKNRLKFRVWDVVSERFVTRSSGGYGWPDSSEIKLNLDGELFVEEEYGKEILSSSRYIIQQYTGLQDSDGKDIYEGDIIKTSYEDPYGEEGALIHNYYEVLFYCGEFEINSAEYSIGINGFCIKKIKTTSEDHQYSLGQIYPLAKEIKKRNYGAFGLDAAKSEIVGNIFENKDLLK